MYKKKLNEEKGGEVGQGILLKYGTESSERDEGWSGLGRRRREGVRGKGRLRKRHMRDVISGVAAGVDIG